MHALSLLQPWATLLAHGAKIYETRGWKTQFRGTYLIHASKRLPSECKALFQTEPFATILNQLGYQTPQELPTGAIIGSAEITNCLPTEILAPKLSAVELSFGNYCPGRFAFENKNPTPFKNPIPCSGNLNFWKVPASILEACPKIGRHSPKVL